MSDYPWGKHSCFIDVGGAQGSFLAKLLTACNVTTGILFDQPQVHILPSGSGTAMGLSYVWCPCWHAEGLLPGSSAISWCGCPKASGIVSMKRSSRVWGTVKVKCFFQSSAGPLLFPLPLQKCARSHESQLTLGFAH